MKSKQLHTNNPTTYAVIFDKGDTLMDALLAFAKERNLSASSFTGIGAFSGVTLGFFDRERKEYKKIKIQEQVEVLSLVGDISLKDGEPKLHAHVVLGKSDGTAHGGHIIEADVWPTLELIITESPAHLLRRHDPETGLALIDLDTGA